MREAFETNILGALRMCEAFLPLLRKGEQARIVNVSSGAGSLATMRGGPTGGSFYDGEPEA